MKTHLTKKSKEKTHQMAAANRTASIAKNNSVSLEDNRASTIIQQKQIDAINATIPIQKKKNNTGLPDNLKLGMENLSGHSMDDVKVHYNSSKPAQLNAHAYAQGTNIHLASGQEKHLPHEAWHVVQQKQGRVQPTTTVAGAKVNDNVGLEKEADVMGAKALQRKVIVEKKSLTVTTKNNVVQTVGWNPFSTKKGKASGVIAGLGLGALGLAAAGIGGAGLAIAGGVGLVGGLGYLGYKKFKDNPLEHLKNTRRNVPRKNKLLHKVMTETMDNPDPITASFGSAHPKGDTSRKDHQVRSAGYNVRLDENIQNPQERQRYLLHELTHARADRRYGMNQHLTFANLHLRGATDHQIGQNMTHQRNYLTKKLQAANRSLQSDTTLTQAQRLFIQGRLNYAIGNPDNEYDTVMSELVLYFHQENIPKNSPFSKRIKRMTHEAHQRRN